MTRTSAKQKSEQIAIASPAPPLPEHCAFGSIRYGLGTEPKLLRLESIDAFEQGDTYLTSVYFRNGRTVQVSWLTVDDMLRRVDENTKREFVRFAVLGQDESYLVIARDSADEYTATATGTLVHLAGGKAVNVHGLKPEMVRSRIAEGDADRTPAVASRVTLSVAAANLPSDLLSTEEEEQPVASVSLHPIRLNIANAIDGLTTLVSMGVRQRRFLDQPDPRHAAAGLVRQLRQLVTADMSAPLLGVTFLNDLVQRIRSEVAAVAKSGVIVDYPYQVIAKQCAEIAALCASAPTPAQRSFIPVISPLQVRGDLVRSGTASWGE